MYITHDTRNDNETIDINVVPMKTKVNLEKIPEETLLDRKYRYAPVQCPVCEFLVPSDIVYDAYGFDPNEGECAEIQVSHGAKDLIIKHTVSGPELTCPHCKSRFIESAYAKEKKTINAETLKIIVAVSITLLLAIGIVVGVRIGVPKLIEVIKNIPKPEPKPEPSTTTTAPHGLSTIMSFIQKMTVLCSGTLVITGVFDLAKCLIDVSHEANWARGIIRIAAGLMLLCCAALLLK